VAFTTRNANGEGDYFDGIAPTCAAGDDLDHAIGDPLEASLAEALRFVATGACSMPPAGATARAARTPASLSQGVGLQQLIGAW
jgi:hypothetical protein